MSRSSARETALSKTDMMILRLLLLPITVTSSAPWSSPPSLQRSIAWQTYSRGLFARERAKTALEELAFRARFSSCSWFPFHVSRVHV